MSSKVYRPSHFLVSVAHSIWDYKNNKDFVKGESCIASTYHSPGIDFYRFPQQFICFWLARYKAKWRRLICLLLLTGAFGIDRSYSYSASLGKYYNKGSLSPHFLSFLTYCWSLRLAVEKLSKVCLQSMLYLDSLWMTVFSTVTPLSIRWLFMNFTQTFMVHRGFNCGDFSSNTRVIF